MSEAHQIGADLVVAATLVLLVAALWSVLDGRRSGGTADHRFAVDRALLLVVALVALNDLLGVALIGTGRPPSDSLHLLYGVAALVSSPVGWWLGGVARSGGPPTRLRRDAWLSLAAVATLGLELRLFMTG